jgi:hypothetical protein
VVKTDSRLCIQLPRLPANFSAHISKVNGLWLVGARKMTTSLTDPFMTRLLSDVADGPAAAGLRDGGGGETSGVIKYSRIQPAPFTLASRGICDGDGNLPRKDFVSLNAVRISEIHPVEEISISRSRGKIVCLKDILPAFAKFEELIQIHLIFILAVGR